MRACLLSQARYAIDARIDVLQIRERDMEAGPLASIVSAVMAMAKGTSTCVVVNDRVDIALACGADGVHLRADSMAPAAVRSIAPPGFIVGLSIHTADEAAHAGPDVDYVIAGTVWETRSKPAGHRVLGPDGLARVVVAARVPVLGIGGVTVDRLPAILDSGAAGIAAIGLFMASPEARGGRSCGAVPLASLMELARAKTGAPG